MKKKLTILALFQLLFTSLQVYLVLRISFIGKIGIAIAYKQYAFLRSGWKTFFLLFGVQLLVIGVLWYFREKHSRMRMLVASGVIVLIALIGLWLTYSDFVHTYTHRLLKERFHLGFYLFWAGMMVSAVFFAVSPQKTMAAADGITEPAQ